MTIEFKRGKRENVSLMVGLAGGTGSGKTFTAMRLASGIAGDKPFAVIDTESGRALHYADRFRFDHAELRAPFRPKAYGEAIIAAEAAGYPVIVVDSASHLWSGDGGMLDWQEDELDRMAGKDFAKRDQCKMASWIRPKMEYKSDFVNKLLQVRAHVILCFRAEEKIEMERDEKGKMKIVPKKSPIGIDGWIPITEKSLPFELTASFLLLAREPGIPHPIKLQEQHRPIFGEGKPIDEDCGRRLAEWAAGKAAAVAVRLNAPAPDKQGPTTAGVISTDQAIELDDKLREKKLARSALLAAIGASVDRLSLLPAEQYAPAKAWIEAQT